MGKKRALTKESRKRGHNKRGIYTQQKFRNHSTKWWGKKPGKFNDVTDNKLGVHKCESKLTVSIEFYMENININ